MATKLSKAQLDALVASGFPLTLDNGPIYEDLEELDHPIWDSHDGGCADGRRLFRDLQRLAGTRFGISYLSDPSPAAGETELSFQTVMFELCRRRIELQLTWEESTTNNLGRLLDTINVGLAETNIGWRFCCMRARAEYAEYRVTLIPLSWAHHALRDKRLVTGLRDETYSRGKPVAFTPISIPVVTIDELVPEARVYVSDGECIMDADCYVEEIEAWLALTQGEASYDHIECLQKDESTRELALVRGRDRWSFNIDGVSDYLDSAAIRHVNATLPAGATRQPVEVRDGAWGQEYGVAYVDEHERKRLEEHGMLPT